jgi:hypothetical protein
MTAGTPYASTDVIRSDTAPNAAAAIRARQASKANLPCHLDGGRERRDGGIQELALLAGSSAIRRSAISAATEASQFASGIREIIEAKASAALTRGNCANLPASVHGSTSSRAMADAMLSGIPFSSFPIEAKRKSSNPEFSRENRAGQAIYLPSCKVFRIWLLLCE